MVNIGVAYKSIPRKEGVDSGFTDKICSVTIHTSKGCSIFHGQRETFIPIPVFQVKGFQVSPERFGVYVDFPGGILAFYWLSAEAKTLIHTIHTTFTEPLHPAFTILSGSLTLCTVAKLEMNNVQTCFTPELITEKNGISYRSKCSKNMPGSFRLHTSVLSTSTTVTVSPVALKNLKYNHKVHSFFQILDQITTQPLR
ncbi:FSD1-like protein isoform X2 [Thalassophryne amazonica]|uniref:FSD1-like protein isoform X2 n=1 Tax=Thalassophryne amazonica TaxID=390379 RepID=UPI00147216AC|nr:FSD1-like protein isoform X2 [Thalassophryne amazonica]